MARSLQELEREILKDDHAKKEWMALDQEVNEAITIASEPEIEEFVESGAGELLDMICSAYREMNSQTKF